MLTVFGHDAEPYHSSTDDMAIRSEPPEKYVYSAGFALPRCDPPSHGDLYYLSGRALVDTLDRAVNTGCKHGTGYRTKLRPKYTKKDRITPAQKPLEALRERLKEAGVTQRDLAEVFGINQTSVRRRLSGYGRWTKSEWRTACAMARG